MNLKNLKLGQTVVLAAEAQWGFDLTDISAENWKKVLKAVGASDKPTHNSNAVAWVWNGKGIKIHTGNNPITGKSTIGRKDEKGYAGGIGLYGDKALVEKAAKMIHDLADGIKEETPHSSRFI